MSASPEENKSLAEDEGMDGKVPKIQISRLLGSNLPEWPYITLGIGLFDAEHSFYLPFLSCHIQNTPSNSQFPFVPFH